MMVKNAFSLLSTMAKHIINVQLTMRIISGVLPRLTLITKCWKGGNVMLDFHVEMVSGHIFKAKFIVLYF